jgi:hypothetical protein
MLLLSEVRAGEGSDSPSSLQNKLSHIFPFICSLQLLTSLLILQTVDCTTQSYRWIFPCRIVGLKSGYSHIFEALNRFATDFVAVSPPPPSASLCSNITCCCHSIFSVAAAVSRYYSVWSHMDVSLTDGARCMTCPNYISGRNVRN